MELKVCGLLDPVPTPGPHWSLRWKIGWHHHLSHASSSGCLWWQLDCDRNDVADAGNDDDADDCVDDRWRVQHSCGRPPASEAAPGPHRTPVSLINCYLTIHCIHCTIETTIHSSSQCTIVTIAMHCLRMLFTWSYCPLQLKMQWNTNTAYSMIQSKQPQQDTHALTHLSLIHIWRCRRRG